MSPSNHLNNVSIFGRLKHYEYNFTAIYETNRLDLPIGMWVEIIVRPIDDCLILK